MNTLITDEIRGRPATIWSTIFFSHLLFTNIKTNICVCVCVCVCVCKYSVSQELKSIIQDLIPELMLSQKRHKHTSPICKGSGVKSFRNTVNKLERKEEHCALTELCC